MAEHRLSLAVNGRERELHRKLVLFEGRRPSGPDGGRSAAGAAPQGVAAVVGLGYVGLPTALSLHGRRSRIIGIDISAARLDAIAGRRADLSDADRPRLKAALDDGSLELTGAVSAAAEADAVIICVPTPVDGDRTPDLSALRAACAAVVASARAGQTIILTSTTYVGTTTQLLTEPLARRGLRAGTDVFVAFSPERIDPGNPDHVQRDTPRVVGGATAECARRAATVIADLTDRVYLTTSPEVAEAVKLYENIFRAVSLALANEFADVCGTLGLDPVEVTLAAGTKPYGFLGALPGPGVGGHCIPCDPHYLLWQLRGQGHTPPLIEQAMRSIDRRPQRVVERAAEVLAAGGRSLSGARVLVLGVSYKAGVADLRESPALPIIEGLARRGAEVGHHDPLVPVLRLGEDRTMRSEPAPRGADWDLVVVHTLHPGVDRSWVRDCPRVLDATYQFDGGGAACLSVV